MSYILFVHIYIIEIFEFVKLRLSRMVPSWKKFCEVAQCDGPLVINKCDATVLSHPFFHELLPFPWHHRWLELCCFLSWSHPHIEKAQIPNSPRMETWERASNTSHLINESPLPLPAILHVLRSFHCLWNFDRELAPQELKVRHDLRMDLIISSLLDLLGQFSAAFLVFQSHLWLEGVDMGPAKKNARKNCRDKAPCSNMAKLKIATSH